MLTFRASVSEIGIRNVLPLRVAQVMEDDTQLAGSEQACARRVSRPGQGFLQLRAAVHPLHEVALGTAGLGLGEIEHGQFTLADHAVQ